MAVLTDRQALVLGGGAVLVGGLLVWWVSRNAGEVVDGVGGLLTGDNQITEGTVYEGKGVAGTLGSATNQILGGLPELVGSGLGGWFGDLVHGDDIEKALAPVPAR